MPHLRAVLRSARRAVVWLILFTVAALLGRATIIDDANLSLVCPAAGVGALWAATTTPRRRPLALAGIAVGTATAYLLTGAAGDLALLVAGTNALQAAVFAALARRWLPGAWDLGGAAPAEDVRDLTTIAVSAALGCLSAAATGSVVVGLVGGVWDLAGFFVWWGRNSVGLITLTLLGLLAGAALGRTGGPRRRPTPARIAAASTTTVATYGVYLLVFHLASGSALAFLVLAPTLVVGLTCRPLTATVHALLCTVLAVGETLDGEGPFAAVDDVASRALVTQAFVLLVVAVSLALSVTRSHERRMVRELRDAQTRWGLLLDSLPEMTVLTLDPQLRVGRVAGAGAWMTGLSGAEGRLLSTVSTPTNLEVVGDLVTRALDGERPSTDIVATGNGRQHHLLATALPAADGAQPEVLVVARDVSREREHERAITVARDRAEQLFTAAPHGVAVLDGDGRLRQLNPALCRLLGRPESSLVGEPLARCSARDDDPTLPQHLAEVTAVDGGVAQAPRETTWQIRDAWGRVRTVALSSSLLPGDDRDDAAREVLTTVVDVSEQARLQARLHHLAHHDPLTGLANRRWFEDELARHLREGGSGALLLLDLDHFKAVNDVAGHAAGDRLLVDLAAQLHTRLRPSDLLARLGGDEFAVLVPDVDLAEAERAASAVVRAVAEHAGRSAGPQQRVTASVGGVLLGGRDVPSLLEAADRMLYVAKRRGRNQQVLRGAVSDAPGTGDVTARDAVSAAEAG